MDTHTSDTDWVADLVSLLTDLSEVQDELLDVLTRKRERMAENDLTGMAALQTKEERLLGRLQDCQTRRSELLKKADDQNLPSDSVGTLATVLPEPDRDKVGTQVQELSHRMRLLQHHSLTNWVVAQRTVLHLSQMLEIIATGGRLQPTYGNDESVHSSGSLVDRAA